MRFVILFIILLATFIPSGYGETYKWVDEKGTVHFTDDLSNIPEKYRQEAETSKPPEETSPRQRQEMPSLPAPSDVSEPEGITVDLVRKNELFLAAVFLNRRVKQYFFIDTGASFTLINRHAAGELGITIDETTPFIRVASVTDVVPTPLVTLESIRVGDAEVENVEVLIYSMAGGGDGLLGNSFLNKFKVVLDSINGKMTLYPLKGIPSPECPGGYTKEYWVGQFRFYHGNLEDLKKMKARVGNQVAQGELNHINNTIRYFENKLDELERKASFAGVPRNWRQ